MTEKFLKITVITPSFNQGKYIEETILSVIGQNYPDLEYIIIDGGSSDETVDVIKKHSDKITYWISEKDKGQSDALNKGFARASGDIVAWLNSDDCYMPGSLMKVNDIFQKNSEVDFIHGKSLLFGKGKKDQIVGDNSKTKELHLKYLSCIPFPQPSSFFRKELLKENLFSPHLHYGMDYHFYAAAVLKGRKGKYIDEVFSKYRLHDESKSMNDLMFSKDWANVFSKILVSLNAPVRYINYLKQLDLYFDNNDRFNVAIKLSEVELKQIFLEHLNVQVHYNYTALELNRVIGLCEVIKEVDLQYYHENKLNLINIRAHYPKFLIRIIRLFTRK